MQDAWPRLKSLWTTPARTRANSNRLFFKTMSKKFFFNRRSGEDRRSGEEQRENPRLDLPHRRRRRNPDRRATQDPEQVLAGLRAEVKKPH